jgi:uncharacterized protein YndB with AHSA1/START domain
MRFLSLVTQTLTTPCLVDVRVEVGYLHGREELARSASALRKGIVLGQHAASRARILSAMVDPQDMPEETRVVSARRDIAAGALQIFELIADPQQQPRWDGNDNLRQADPNQRVRAVGDVFVMHNTKATRENHVVEFEEGRRIAWNPSEPGKPPPGHLWRWELEPLDDRHTRVTHTYDWSGLTDESRFERARWTTSERLRASLDRLAALAEGE